MKKVLYIHGLDSNPNPKKLAIIENLGQKVVSPFIDYEKEKGDVYQRVKAIAIEADIDMIIGSSLGGFIGFWLAKDLGIPALLFNPALYFENMQGFIPEVDPLAISETYICLGENDPQVNPLEVKKYLEKLNPTQAHLKIILASWLKHGIDLTTFRSMTSWFIEEEK